MEPVNIKPNGLKHQILNYIEAAAIPLQSEVIQALTGKGFRYSAIKESIYELLVAGAIEVAAAKTGYGKNTQTRRLRIVAPTYEEIDKLLRVRWCA